MAILAVAGGGGGVGRSGAGANELKECMGSLAGKEGITWN